jgi:glycosyltransferase involved in cell wall biosynthesis
MMTRVILSTGIGRLHLVQSAMWLCRLGVEMTLIQGWVPLLPESWLAWIGRRIGHPRLAFGMRARRPPELNDKIKTCASAEFFHQALIRLARHGVGEYWRAARLSWRFFGWQSARYLRHADIFHVRSGAGQGGAIKAARRRGMRVLVDHSIAHPCFMEQHLKDEYHRNGQEFGFSPDNPFWQLVLKDCEEADLLLVNSVFVKDTFVQAGYPVDKIRVAYLGVRPDFFNLKTDYTNHVLRQSERPLRLLFTGGFGFRKGAEYLLAALFILRQRGLNVVLTVVGNHEEARSLLSNHASVLPYVELVGHVPQDDLKKYLAEADLYVFPSLAEGCASSGMEAMAAGLCVVCTMESGLPISDGCNGFFVPAKNARELADKIEWLGNHPAIAEQAGRTAARLIQKQYTWERYAENVRSIYQELCGS